MCAWSCNPWRPFRSDCACLAFLCLSFGLPSLGVGGPASVPEPVATSIITTNANPGWLSSLSKTVVLEVEHENLSPACRVEAGMFVEALLSELVNAKVTLCLSPRFLKSELTYYRSHLADEKPRAIAEGVMLALEDALRRGEIDWSGLHELHVRAPNSDAVARHLPWLSVAPGRPQRRLASDASDAPAAVPSLIVRLRWSGIPVRGVAAMSGRREEAGAYFRLSEQRPVPGVYFGEQMLWKIDAGLCLQQSGSTRVLLSYAAPAWQKNYEGVGSTPLFVTREAMIRDIRTGVVALPEPVGDPKAKRKTKQKPAGR